MSSAAVTDSDYCDLLVALTEQRDQNSLADCLVDTARKLNPDSRYWLYDYQEADQSAPRLIKSTEPLSDAAPDLNHRLLPQQEARFFFSQDEKFSYYGFGILHSLSGVLVCDRVEQSSELHPIMQKLVRVYSNQRFFMFSALNDALTGLSNRQAFDQQISHLLQQNSAKRRSSDKLPDLWCFALLDIDHFKRVNDDYGHLFGDEVLLIFAQLMQSTFREDDLLFRYGGEEFAVALRGISLDTADQVLNRFREVVAQAEFPQLGQVTVSIGYTAIEDGVSLPLLIDRADQALYFAKENGRNQVHSFEALASSGKVQLANTFEGDIELF
ncbi:GGDEF domain-containing protein [Neptuniibacter halophilus]|uniref:GGDEF domain-containing protein n=1 Tax=Neptuniibacter halophilus TaxID=651666 RepID=UPI0025739D6B|nr:GGDEF domain-containing protein [Neptuniibacter halophilus]